MFVSLKCNTWYGDRVSNQSKGGVAPGNVNVLSEMPDLKPLYARWIIEMRD